MKFIIIAFSIVYANLLTGQLMMKARDRALKNLLLSLTLALSILQLSAQTGFLDYQYVWIESYSCFHYPPYEANRYTIDSLSTQVNGYSYFEVLKSPTPVGENFEGTGNLIRSDDSNRVYFYNGTEEITLYDFNLAVGDTFETNNDYDCVIVVGEIDTITLENGEERRKWIFYNSGEDYHPEYSFGYYFWIEGIGHQLGLFGNNHMCQIDGCGTNLLCMSYQDTLIYMGGDSCWITTTGIIDSYSESIQIFPNPVSEILKISDPYLQIENIRILNLHGSLLIEKHQSEINMKHLPEGFYFLQITLKNGQNISRALLKI